LMGNDLMNLAVGNDRWSKGQCMEQTREELWRGGCGRMGSVTPGQRHAMEGKAPKGQCADKQCRAGPGYRIAERSKANRGDSLALEKQRTDWQRR